MQEQLLERLLLWPLLIVLAIIALIWVQELFGEKLGASRDTLTRLGILELQIILTIIILWSFLLLCPQFSCHSLTQHKDNPEATFFVAEWVHQLVSGFIHVFPLEVVLMKRFLLWWRSHEVLSEVLSPALLAVYFGSFLCNFLVGFFLRDIVCILQPLHQIILRGH